MAVSRLVSSLLALSCLAIVVTAGSAPALASRAQTQSLRGTQLHSIADIKEVNYYPAARGWAYMWTKWDPAAIGSDFARIHGLGANTVRIVIQPSAFGYPTVSPVMAKRLSTVVAMAAAHALRVQLTLFDWWRQYGDIQGSEHWVSSLLSHYRHDGRVAVVELHNEIDPEDPKAIAWVKRLLPYLSKVLPGTLRTVSVASIPPPEFQHFTQELSHAKPDFWDYHFYGVAKDALSRLGWLKQIAGSKPLFIGEIGYSTDQSASAAPATAGQPTPEQAQATWYQSLFAATDALQLPRPAPWTLNDFSPGAIPPGQTASDASQYGYGLYEVNGTPKPAAAVVAHGFARALNLPARTNMPSHPVCTAPSKELATCEMSVGTSAGGKPLAASGPVGYGPAQFRTAYSLPSLTKGIGQTIGIVDAYDDPTAEHDLATYDAAFGLPACTTANGCFTKVNQTGGSAYPPANGGWALEISLDVQIAHAACPNCKILLVEANSNSFSNLLTAEDYATSHATVVSNSWGGPESSSEKGYDSHFNRSVPIMFSSGDSGYGVEYPASSPYVIAVGGTTLKLTTTNTRASETAWSGSGSGCSAYEPKPPWQHDTGCSRRTVADMSADADPNTGAAVYDSTHYCAPAGCGTGWYQVGGTSLAAPLAASTYALAGFNATTTYYGSVLYANVGSFLYDVVSGSNGSCGGSYLCTARTGYDGPTGLGTPKF
jgi:hypothetical protein